MNSKERVTNAFNKKEIDHIPMNYLCNIDIDHRLKKYYALDVNDNDGLLKALNVDFRGVGHNYIGERLHEEKEGIFVDPCFGVNTRWIEHETGGYYDYCNFPLAGLDYDTAKNWKMPNPDDFDYADLKKQCEKYKDYYITYMNQPDIINATGMIMGMEDVLVGLMTDDEGVLTYIDRRLEVQLEQTKKTFEVAGDYIDCLWIGEDLGTQHTPLISLDLFRKHIKPRHKKFVDVAKKYGKKVMLHSCGSSSWSYNDFIEIGVDIVDTLQPEATNMQPKYLLDTYGDKLCFHGMISTAGPLAYGTVDDVIANCKETLDIMYGHGYAMAPTHAIQDNSPTENVVAMYEYGLKYSK